MYQNLHCHTKILEGELNHQEVLDFCKQLNISVVAFTDHDSIPNKRTVEWLQDNKSHPTKWIVGCELSSAWPKELEHLRGDFHIVGLFVNPFDKDLVKHCQKAQKARIERMEKIIKSLQPLGFEITKEECLEKSGGNSATRADIVSVLIKKERNLRIIEQLKQEMAKEATHNPVIKQKYDEMIDRGENQYPYFLFLGPDAFIPNIYVDYPHLKDMDGTVKLIRRAGGVAFLAHWWTYKKTLDKKLVEKFLQEKRLDGAETVFGIGYLPKEKIEKDMEVMKDLAEKYNLLQSGGGDSHTKADFEFFAQEKWFAQKTIGLAQKMMKVRKLNLKFSSLK